MLRFIDFIPGTMIRLVFDLSGDYDAPSGRYEDITIGATGNYYADDVEKVYGIYLMLDKSSGNINLPSGSGTITYEYEVPARNMFDLITNIQTNIECYGQIVGKCDNIIESFNNIREQVTQVTMSHYHKRPIEYLFYGAGSKIVPGYWWNGYDANGYRKMALTTPKLY